MFGRWYYSCSSRSPRPQGEISSRDSSLFSFFEAGEISVHKARFSDSVPQASCISSVWDTLRSTFCAKINSTVEFLLGQQNIPIVHITDTRDGIQLQLP